MLIADDEERDYGSTEIELGGCVSGHDVWSVSAMCDDSMNAYIRCYMLPQSIDAVIGQD